MLLKLINPENVTEEEAQKFDPRLAARGVVFNNEGNVAVLHVSNHHYYKLPGGGIEGDEDKETAFRRECLEEIGYDVEVLADLGHIVEYRPKFNKVQTSYCYVGRIIGEQKPVALTDSEKSQGFEAPLWVPIDEALKLVSSSKPTDYQGGFINARDTLIIEEAMKKNVQK
jgi:8-oxo-dGTP pyrophosphatase MutT (NUDIX family)